MKTYQLTDQEIDLIAAALGKLPYETSYQLIHKLKELYVSQLEKEKASVEK